MKKRFYLGMVMLLALSMILAACGGDDNGGGDNGGDEGESNPDFIGLATGGTGGTYYPLGGTFANLINDETGINTDAITSNASAENMAMIDNGEAEVAFVQTDIASYAVEGTQMFDQPIETIRGLATLYPETIQIVTTADSGIESVEDLAGKTVSVGESGSGTRLNAEQILEVHGMSFDDMSVQNLSFDDSTTGIQDGSIDAAFITGGTPTGAVEGLAAQVDVVIVPVAEDKAQELINEYPFYSTDEVASGIYGLESAVPTVAVQAMLAVSSELSDDLVYDITKAIFENTDSITHPKGEFISADTALQGIGIDVHPGAQRYFDEQGVEAE
ncbi:TAXI family TRAP transporter solute-binding subunit [Jeotgalibacillus proteolyticus]|uniref:C4-dicarboxylate ABC transporter substrate-binding protein n=1 Tax=Jeotgalibacillus proteolyticus TaxID=2082395 RepID=A0A2S5GGX6_9BACL|nr:TAXI family TRAP transporter solute-binding subunit [Jeotgalibacillus proteolyticus]PPA72300.1 C4-dicarboxylate ABC transporter substrate-binding protein [Jeotgalibacillus proteolyticus]